jgi:hypothetical protein
VVKLLKETSDNQFEEKGFWDKYYTENPYTISNIFVGPSQRLRGSLDQKFTTSNFMRVSDEALKFQLSALYPVPAQKDQVRIDLLFLNHDKNVSTFLTIKYLAEHQRVADIYVLSRSMFESAISMGLLAKSLVASDISRYQEFQYLEIYKTYAHLKRLGLENLSGLSASDVKKVSDRRSEYVNDLPPIAVPLVKSQSR